MVRTRSQVKSKETGEKEETIEKPTKKRSATSPPTSPPPKKSKRKKTRKSRTSEEPEIKTLERGKILFFYRPRVNLEHVKSFDDVSRLYVILEPEGIGKPKTKKKRGPPKKTPKNRLIVIPKKQLPEIEHHQRLWAFVKSADQDIDVVKSTLEEEEYETKTRGERVAHGARMAGEGVYSIIQHGRHSHLAYVLEVPDEIGKVQNALNISKEGSFVIAIKNPKATSPEYVGLKEEQRAHYPKRLQKEFGTLRFHPLDPLELIEYPGVEMILIGASGDVEKELGSDGYLLEEMADHSFTPEQAMEEVHMKPGPEHPMDSLTKEDWV